MLVHDYFGVVVSDFQEGALLKNNNFVRANCLTEMTKVLLQLIAVGNQEAGNGGPGLIQGLIPNRRLEALNLEAFRLSDNLSSFVLVHLLPECLLDKIHFVHQNENLCVFGKLVKGVNTVVIVLEVLLGIVRVHVENVDQHLNVLENVIAL